MAVDLTAARPSDRLPFHSTWVPGGTTPAPAPSPVFGGVSAADAGTSYTTDGTGNNRSAFTTHAAYAASKKTYMRLPEGVLAMSGGELVTPEDCAGVIGPGSGICTLKFATNTHHGLRTVGTFGERHYRKRVEGLSILGPIGAPPRNGKAALVSDRCPQIVTRDVVVDGFDIGRDFINNCFNSCDYDLFGKRTDEQARSLNVFIRLRAGPDSGSDNHFYNCQGAGLVSAVVMDGPGGGNHFIGGSFGTGGMPAAGDKDGNGRAKFGVFTIGLNYETGQVSTGVGNVLVQSVHVEGWRGRDMLRQYGDSPVHFLDFGGTASAGNGGDTGPTSEQATGLIHVTDLGGGKITFSQMSLGQSFFSRPDVIFLEGAVNDGAELSFPGRRLGAGTQVAGVGQFEDFFTTGWDISNQRESVFVSGHAFTHPQGKAGLLLGRMELLTDQGQQAFIQRFAGGTITGFNPLKDVYHAGGDTGLADYEPGVCVFYDNAADHTYTIEANCLHGAKGAIVQLGAGKMTVVGGTGVTVRGTASTSGPNTVVRWEKVGNNVVCAGAGGVDPVALGFDNATPYLLRGSFDLSRYPGVTVGPLPNAAARTANGTALQAAFDWANSNGKYIEAPSARLEYIATGTQNGRNVGLQYKPGAAGIIGAGSSATTGTRLLNYAQNHPVITLGLVDAKGGVAVEGATFKGFVAGHGVSQLPVSGTNQDQADGILFGRIWRSILDDLYASPLAGNHAWIGMRFGVSGAQFFFSNTVGNLRSGSGQRHLLRQDAEGTGNAVQSLYCGGGGFGNRIALSGAPVSINNSGNEFGSVAQLNIEWTDASVQSSALDLNSCDGMDIGTMHLEGVKMNGFDPRLIMCATSRVSIATLKMLDVWIASANASGTPCILRSYGGPVVNAEGRFRIGQMNARWGGTGYNAEAVASMAFRLFGDDAAVVGRKPTVEVGSLDMAGHTGAFSLDATLLGAAPGAAGAIPSLGTYSFNKGRSRTTDATITMGNADLTVYGAHRMARITVPAALTANRTLTLSDRIAATGAGAASVRSAGDIVHVHRIGAGAFDLVVNNQSGAALTTFTGAASANTELAFEWSGTAWAAL